MIKITEMSPVDTRRYWDKGGLHRLGRIILVIGQCRFEPRFSKVGLALINMVAWLWSINA